MNQNQLVFVIDAGNTFLKIGVFRGTELEKVMRFSLGELDLVSQEMEKEGQPPVFISSVLSDEDTKKLLDHCPNSTLLDQTTPLPIQIKYNTPASLGLDRICNAVACYKLSKGKHAVGIDLGTCIKFDFTDKEGNYFGGSISPGINLRYASMNDYTGKLPYIQDRIIPELIGMNTQDSMRSGVMNGIKAEIERFIQLYTEQYQDLTFFMTGGDAVYFDFPLKNNIFVNENLTLIGLYQIYVFNAK